LNPYSTVPASASSSSCAASLFSSPPKNQGYIQLTRFFYN
jgi:hypothetical protein